MDDSVREPSDSAPSLLRRVWLAIEGWLVLGLGCCVAPMWVQPHDTARQRRPGDLTDAEWRAWRELEPRLRGTPDTTTNHDLSGER